MPHASQWSFPIIGKDLQNASLVARQLRIRGADFGLQDRKPIDPSATLAEVPAIQVVAGTGNATRFVTASLFPALTAHKQTKFCRVSCFSRQNLS